MTAALRLHEEVGPARTTVAEIARRAGVQRLTVYNHFPEEADLVHACQEEWLSRHPPPDLGPAFARSDPVERLWAALEVFYGWYRATQQMTDWVQRDRAAVAALDDFQGETADAHLDELAATLAAGFAGRGKVAQRRRVLVRLGLDFWTWQRLSTEGLDDRAAAAVMAWAAAGA